MTAMRARRRRPKNKAPCKGYRWACICRYYRLRVQPAEGAPVMTAMRARCLAGSGLREAFEAHLDVAGHVLALSWSTPTGSCQAQGGSPVLPQDWSFAEVQRAPTRMPARGPTLHPSRPAFSGRCPAPHPGHASQDQVDGKYMQAAATFQGRSAGPCPCPHSPGKVDQGACAPLSLLLQWTLLLSKQDLQLQTFPVWSAWCLLDNVALSWGAAQHQNNSRVVVQPRFPWSFNALSRQLEHPCLDLSQCLCCAKA